MIGTLIKRENLDPETHTHTGRIPCENEARDSLSHV